MKLIVGLLWAVLLAGCGAQRMTPIAPQAVGDLQPDLEDAEGGHVAMRPGFSPKNYAVIILTPFKVAPTEIKDGEDALLAKHMPAQLQAQLLTQLRMAGIFTKIIDASHAAPVLASEKALRLEGDITKLTEGSQAVRYFVGFGAGAAKAQIETRLVDVQSAQVQLVTADRRAAGMGAFGGDGREFVIASINQMAEAYVKLLKHLSNGGRPGPR
jgi:hypothetical protein